MGRPVALDHDATVWFWWLSLCIIKQLVISTLIVGGQASFSDLLVQPGLCAQRQHNTPRGHSTLCFLRLNIALKITMTKLLSLLHTAQ